MKVVYRAERHDAVGVGVRVCEHHEHIVIWRQAGTRGAGGEQAGLKS